MNEEKFERLGDDFEAVWDANSDALYGDDEIMHLGTMTDRERLKAYDDELSRTMPRDFKDWWQGSKNEWPKIAASVIESLRAREEFAWDAASEVEILRAKVQAMQDAIEWLLFYAEQDEEFEAPGWLLSLVSDRDKENV